MFVACLIQASFVASYARPEATYEVRLDPSAERPLQVWKGDKLLDQTLLPSYKPWKLMIADLEGDGFLEIVVGVERITKYTPVVHKCLFVLRFDGKKIQRKWMGSSMGRPLVDFTFAKRVKDNKNFDQLITLETNLESQGVASVWKWHGFGFRKVDAAGTWSSPRNFVWDQQLLLVQTSNGSYRVSFENEGN